MIILGVLLWSTRNYLSLESKNSNPKIATIEHLNGKAFFKNAQNEILPLSSNQKIYPNESLMTDQGATLSFSLASGANFEMGPSSKIIFEDLQTGSTHRASLTILEGQIQLISEPSDKESFEVTKKGQNLSLSELKTEIPKVTETQDTAEQTAPTPQPHLEKTAKKNIVKQGTSLADDDIDRVMHNQTSFLHRCYINYMLRTQKLDLEGQVVLSFSIEPSGKVRDTKIVSSPAQDSQLDHCLIDVVNRARFKEFSSQPIFVQAYPIHLD